MNIVTHELKLNLSFCDAVYYGLKTFEIRKNDRGFQTGDHIHFTPVRKNGRDGYDYPSHPIEDEEYEITYIISGWGLQPDYIVFSFAPIYVEEG